MYDGFDLFRSQHGGHAGVLRAMEVNELRRAARLGLQVGRHVLPDLLH